MTGGGDREATRPLVTGVVGRAPELLALEARLHHIADGLGGTCLIEGDAGIGKTRLVEAASELARHRDVGVAFAGADPLETGQPFALALSLASALAGGHSEQTELADLVGEGGARNQPLGVATAGSSRAIVAEYLIRECERRAREPVMLIIEDLHNGDEASLAALRAALAVVDDLPLLVIGTTRPTTSRRSDVPLRAALASRGCHLVLSPLDRDSAVELAAALAGGHLGPELTALVDRAGGNPFIITELVRSLHADVKLEHDGTAVELLDESSQELVNSLLLGRIASLHPDTRAVLQTASVLGTSFGGHDLAALWGRAIAELSAPVDEAFRAGVLVEDGRSLRFTHDIVRHMIYQDIPASVRAALHEEAAAVLAGRRARPVVVATHAALGTANDHAVARLSAAADDVMTLAPEAALDLLDQALVMSSGEPAVQIAIQRARVDSLMGAGRVEEARRLAEGLWPTVTDGDRRAELLVTLAGLLVLLREPEEAVGYLDRAVEEASSDQQRVIAMAQGALARLTSGDYDGAAERARRTAAEAENAGVPVARTIAASVLGRLPCSGHGYRDGIRIAMTAVATADADPTGTSHDHLPWFWAGIIALDLDDHDLVRRALAEGRRRADESRAAWAHPLYAGLAASHAHRLGDLTSARVEAEASVSLATDTGSSHARMWSESLLALLAELQGQRDERDQWVAAAQRSFAEGGAMLGIDHFALAQATQLDDKQTVDHLLETWQWFSDLKALNCQPLLAVPLVRAAVDHDRSAVDPVRAEVDRVAALTELPGMIALSRHINGILDNRPDELLAAADCYRDLGRRLDEAEALADAAGAASAIRDPRTEALADAAEVAYDAIDAGGAAERLRLAVGRKPHRPRRTLTGWDSLTSTEREIAFLVGEGLVNGEIADRRHVSRRTVESHLHRIYLKLGQSNRTRLALLAQKHRSS